MANKTTPAQETRYQRENRIDEGVLAVAGIKTTRCCQEIYRGKQCVRPEGHGGAHISTGWPGIEWT